MDPMHKWFAACADTVDKSTAGAQFYDSVLLVGCCPTTEMFKKLTDLYDKTKEELKKIKIHISDTAFKQYKTPYFTYEAHLMTVLAKLASIQAKFELIAAQHAEKRSSYTNIRTTTYTTPKSTDEGI